MRRSAGFLASAPRKVFSIGHLQKAIASVILSGLLSSLAAAAPGDPLDLTQVSFEQLLSTQVTSATKLAKQVSEASSAVSVVTAPDIKAYGYRTLGDILRSMRGLTMSSDSSGYSYLSGRGFGAQQYAGKISLLIDGQLATDSIFGQSYFESDGLLDVELIDRVEYIPGAGSAMYGNGAFLGVINVVTKRGKDIDGTQVAQEKGSHGWEKSRLTFGKTFDSGLDLLVSGSSYSSGGRLVFDKTYGAEERTNVEQSHRLFLKASYEGWGLEAGSSRRPYFLPLSVTSSVDENTFASLHYDTQASSTLKVSVRGSFGDYLSQTWGTDWNVRDSLRGRWNSLHAKFVGSWFDDHTLVFGVEHRNDFKQRLDFGNSRDYTIAIDPAWALPVADTSLRTDSVYLYDAYDLNNRFELNYGFRHDRTSSGQESVSPRAALIYKPRASTVLKLSSGMSNRQVAASDRYWTYNNLTNALTGDIPSGQQLPTERVLLNEFVWEEQLGPTTRWTGSVYRYRTEGSTVVSSVAPVLLHRKMLSSGIETELETNWEDGARLKASYAWQDSVSGVGGWVEGSPRHSAKLNFTRPIIGERLRLGAEVLAIGSRLGSYDNGDGYRSGGYSLTNLTLTSTQALPGWSASFSVRNVFNRSYGDAITMDGRNVWLQLSRDFK